jgi:putative transposase
VGLSEERRQVVPKRKYTPEQIIVKLREAEVLLGQGKTAGEACRKLGMTENTYYRWRKEYGGLRLDQAKRMKELEKENTRLKKLVADLSLDNQILKEAASGNF